jgi:crotonobetainyl-CoA:carnitine CoA-transferase CaiB-like acyl-CoA transferase
MCSLVLAESGAQVTKVERPGGGDAMRDYEPKFGADSANFVLLNRGKRFVEIDLKSEAGHADALALMQGADVVLEQFRPGVMDRLGLGFDAVRASNPGVVYCSITGWGQRGPLADVAGHDLNYQAETGLLSLATGADGQPVLPNILAGDLAAGAYPAVMNILLALRARDANGGHGCHIDVSMADNLFPLAYWGLASGFASNAWPRAGAELVTGGSPRYRIYRTKDGRHLACAPLEDKFWHNFLRVIGAPQLEHDEDNERVVRDVSAILATRTAAEWLAAFDGVDACVNLVKALEEAVRSPHATERGIFATHIDNEAGSIPALPVPIAASQRLGS